MKNTPAFSNYAEQEEAELIEVSLSDYLNRLIQAKIKTCLLSSEKAVLTVLTVIRFLMGANVLPVTKCSPSALPWTYPYGSAAALKATGYPILYARMERDSAIIFCLQRNCALSDANELLYELGYEGLA